MRGGTQTFFLIYGDAEWTGGVVCAAVGLDVDEALATVEAMRSQHGTRHQERVTSQIRLCTACAAKSKIRLVLYSQDELEQGGEFDAITQTDEHTRRALGD
jgi:hypothetical protein